MDERSLAGRRGRGLGEPLDVAETERQGATRERAHRARRQRDRHRVRELSRWVRSGSPPSCTDDTAGVCHQRRPSRFTPHDPQGRGTQAPGGTGNEGRHRSDGPVVERYRAPRPGARGARLRRSADGRDRPRRLLAHRPRRGAHRTHRTGDGHRGGVRTYADGARVHGQRPPADVEGSLRARPRLADQAAHREAVLDAVVAPGPAHARVRPRTTGHLGGVERADPAQVRRRVLPPHVDDAVLRAGAEPVRRAQGVPRRGRADDDRGRG